MSIVSHLHHLFNPETCQSGDSSELASRLPCKGKSVRNRGVSQTMPFLVIPRSLLRGGFIPTSIRCAGKIGPSSVPAVRATTLVRGAPTTTSPD